MDELDALDELEWQRDYARLALRLNRHLGDSALVYHGPAALQEETRAEDLPSPATLVDAADALLEQCTGDGSAYRRAHVRAMRAVAAFLADERYPFTDLAHAVTGMEPRWIPETVFEQAHEWLDAALPSAPGTLAERLRAWQETYRLRDPAAIPALVDKAVEECRTRTRALVDLPPD